jgi:hypothetical protein
MIDLDKEQSQNEHLRKDINVHLKLGYQQDVRFKSQQKHAQPTFSFADRLRLQQINRDEKSATNLENEFSM